MSHIAARLDREGDAAQRLAWASELDDVIRGSKQLLAAIRASEEPPRREESAAEHAEADDWEEDEYAQLAELIDALAGVGEVLGAQIEHALGERSGAPLATAVGAARPTTSIRPRRAR
jgi:hypothetical protein